MSGKKIMIIAVAMVTVLTLSQTVFAKRYNVPKTTMQAGDVMVLLKGGLNLLGGQLFDVEKRINSVQLQAVYEDGTVKDSEMTHGSFDFGLQAEYTLNPLVGFQAGYAFQSISQTISVGGDGYEKEEFATGNLTAFSYPYAGVMLYAVNSNDAVLYFCGKVGVTSGSVQPWVTTYDYTNSSIETYQVTGMTYGGGLGMNFVTSDHYVLGCSFIIMQNQMTANKDLVEYQVLDGSIDRKFDFISYDIDFYLGYKF